MGNCFFHSWVRVKDTGFTIYKECRKCGERTYTQASGGYQPIDRQWLNAGGRT